MNEMKSKILNLKIFSISYFFYLFNKGIKYRKFFKIILIYYDDLKKK
jgi:hypothetical protein